MISIKNMTDEELDKAIADKYGDEWTPSTVDPDDELIKEFFSRIEGAID